MYLKRFFSQLWLQFKNSICAETMKISAILLFVLGIALIVGANDEKITENEIQELITDYKELYSDGSGMTGNVS